jgi:uncharacterized protein YdbL (DUF1318 family)
MADDTGFDNSDNLTNDQSLSFSGTAEANSLVSVYDGAALLGTVNATGAGAFTYVHGSNLSEGWHKITATATDSAGNTGSASSDYWVHIDVTAPAVPTVASITTDTGLDNADGLTNDDTWVIAGSAEANGRVELYINGASIGTASVDGSGKWSYDYTGTTLNEGNYMIKAEATDSAGNTGNMSSGYWARVDQTNPAQASVSAISTDSGRDNADGLTNDQSLTVSGSAEANSQVEVFLGGASQGTVMADGSGNWSYTHGSNLAEGMYRFTAAATDSAGNTGTTSANYWVRIDITNPNAPALSSMADDTGFDNSDNLTNDQSLSFSGTAEADALVSVYDGAILLGTVNASGTGAFTYVHGSNLSEGWHKISASATDSAGNTGSASSDYWVHIDVTAPAAPAVASITTDTGLDNADGLTNDDTWVIAGTAEANGRVEVYINGASIGTASVDGSGKWSYDYTGTTLNEGNYMIKAEATDSAGNTGNMSSGYWARVDKTNPAQASVSAISTDSGRDNADGLTNDQS